MIQNFIAEGISLTILSILSFIITPKHLKEFITTSIIITNPFIIIVFMNLPFVADVLLIDSMIKAIGWSIIWYTIGYIVTITHIDKS